MTNSHPAAVEITSFGYLHGGAPEAHVTLDLRCHFRDPHVRSELRELTAYDEPVRQAVMDTPGIRALIAAAAASVRAYASGPSAGNTTVRVAVGCAGGRHRAPVVATAIAGHLTHISRRRIELTHRDLTKPVVHR